MPKNYDQLFMNIARDLAEMSHCARLQVGAVITRDGRIISTGWNGTPPGHQNCDDYFFEKYGIKAGELTSEQHNEFIDYEVHAETNTILFAAKRNSSKSSFTPSSSANTV